jgi:hypothetical protein
MLQKHKYLKQMQNLDSYLYISVICEPWIAQVLRGHKMVAYFQGCVSKHAPVAADFETYLLQREVLRVKALFH